MHLAGNSTAGGYGTFYGGAAQGGGVGNGGTAMLTDCTVSGNSATGGFGESFKGGYSHGGGLFNNGAATLTDCTVSSNSTQGGTATPSAVPLTAAACSTAARPR